MKIKITRELKILLIRALQDGVLDTEDIPELHTLTPARTLTKEEARELWADLEKKY